MRTIKIILAGYSLLSFAAGAVAQRQPSPSGATGSQKSYGESESLSDGMTRSQADAILRELQEIRRLLSANEANGRGKSESSDKIKMTVISGLQVFGDAKAPVTMVEFTDYQCPFCKRFRTGTFEQLKSAYIDTGKVRFVIRDLPLMVHPLAQLAAEAAHCASEQHRSWELREMMSNGSIDLSRDTIYEYARKVGLEMEPFRICVEDNRYADAIKQDSADAGALGIYGTPTFIIGKTAPDVISGRKIVGALPYSDYAAIIDAALSMK